MYDINNIEFGKRLKELRKEKGMTLEEVAKAIYKSKPTIYKYEEGLLEPNLEALLQLANLFDVNLDGLFEKEKEHKTQRDVNPFNTNKLYMYYKGKNAVLISIITIENLSFQKAVFYNCVQSDSIYSKMYKKYTGLLEYEKGIAYFIFESDLKDEFEKVIVQVKVPRGDDEKYYGWIGGDSTAEKIVLLREYIDNPKRLEEIAKDLQITNDEWENIRKNEYWDIDISNEKDLRKKYKSEE